MTSYTIRYYWKNGNSFVGKGEVTERKRKIPQIVLTMRDFEWSEVCSDVAGETRLEHATVGFGDRCSTN